VLRGTVYPIVRGLVKGQSHRPPRAAGVTGRRFRSGSTGIGPNRLSGCDAKGRPFSYPELRGRVSALLRRVNGCRSLGRLRVGDLEVDPPAREVRLRGARIALSQTEFGLLRTLSSDPARV
jgi:hypothetical protein